MNTHLQNIQEIKKGCGYVRENEPYICNENHLCLYCKSKLSGYLLAVKKILKFLEKFFRDYYNLDNPYDYEYNSGEIAHTELKEEITDCKEAIKLGEENG